jgi:hypothetical protein
MPLTLSLLSLRVGYCRLVAASSPPVRRLRIMAVPLAGGPPGPVVAWALLCYPVTAPSRTVPILDAAEGRSRIGGTVPARKQPAPQAQGPRGGPAGGDNRSGRPRRWPAVLAWALLGLELAVFAAFPWIDHLLRQAGRPDLSTMDAFAIPPTVAALTAGAVGAVLASRRPHHPVGWLLLAMGVVMASSGACVGYIPYGLLVRPGSLPAANIVARIYPATIYAVLAIIGFILLLTPTGSPPSPRWRW